MKVTSLIIGLFLTVSIFANNDKGLSVYQDGLTIEVMDFHDGDKLKLFEIETGDHILSKSYASVDLSQLPVGAYRLENNLGQSIIIDRQEESLAIEGAVLTEESDFVVEQGAQMSDVLVTDESIEEDLIDSYAGNSNNKLNIQREGDIITVLNFEEGDKLKLFEVKDTVHVLSKTTNVIELSQLPVGVYLLENGKGESVIIEKFVSSQNDLTEL